MNIHKAFYSYVIIILMTTHGVDAFITGTIDLVLNVGTDHVSRDVASFYADQIPYQSGGITVTYPASLFTMVPSIFVTLVLKDRAYSTTEILVPEVVSNTAASATIRVNVAALASSPIVQEANTNDVILHIRVAGQ